MKKYKELSKRLDKIEKHLRLNTEVTVSKMESIEELPKKWCIKIKEENIPYLNEYLNNQKSKYKGSSESWKVDAVGAYFLSENQKECFHSTYKKPKGYTEIKFDQFKKWVLKEDSKTPEIGVIEPLSIREVQVKVNSQEEANECAEIAKACGEKVDNIIVTEKFNIFRLDVHCDSFFVSSIKKVKFPEISIQEFRDCFGKPKEIDWSKAGQKFVSNGVIDTIVFSNGNHNENTFEGFLLEDTETFKKGYFGGFWRKDLFTLCTEPITLSN